MHGHNVSSFMLLTASVNSLKSLASVPFQVFKMFLLLECYRQNFEGHNQYIKSSAHIN